MVLGSNMLKLIVLQLILGAHGENRTSLFIWLILCMIEIVILAIGSVAFLVIGITGLADRDELQSQGLTPEEVTLGGTATIIAAVVYLVICGKNSHRSQVYVVPFELSIADLW